jgi:hypothetical protein
MHVGHRITNPLVQMSQCRNSSGAPSQARRTIPDDVIRAEPDQRVREDVPRRARVAADAGRSI